MNIVALRKAISVLEGESLALFQAIESECHCCINSVLLRFKDIPAIDDIPRRKKATDTVSVSVQVDPLAKDVGVKERVMGLEIELASLFQDFEAETDVYVANIVWYFRDLDVLDGGVNPVKVKRTIRVEISVQA